MSQENLPEDLIRFIHTSISGIPYLEALLLLRTEPGRAWSVEAVCHRLYLPPTVVSELLNSLCASGMAVEEGPGFRYEPQSEQLRHLIDRLAECYRHNLIEITRVVHSGAGSKAQIFANAFKWKRDP